MKEQKSSHMPFLPYMTRVPEIISPSPDDIKVGYKNSSPSSLRTGHQPRRPRPGDSVSETLTPSEIERLRQDKKESSALIRKGLKRLMKK